MAVKGNQGNLEAALIDFFQEARCESLKTPETFWETLEKDHGRIEARRYWLTDNRFGLVDQNSWCDCRKVGMVESVRDTGGGPPSIERRYFITSAACAVKDFAAAVRDHWQIENRLHWSLDVIFREDECRIRKDHGPQNFSLLRKFGLNLLRLMSAEKKMSLRGRRKRAAWDDGFRMRLLGLRMAG